MKASRLVFGSGLLLMCIFCAQALFCAEQADKSSAQADTIQSNRAKIHTVRWVADRTQYLAEGKQKQIEESVISIKFPDKERAENFDSLFKNFSLFICNGTTCVTYVKSQRYQERRQLDRDIYKVSDLTPEWLINHWKQSGANFTIKKLTMEYKGIAYQTLDADSHVVENGSKIRSVHLRIYIDAGTGLMRAFSQDTYNAKHPEVKRDTLIVDYEYNPVLTDDLFTFTPSPEAIEDQQPAGHSPQQNAAMQNHRANIRTIRLVHHETNYLAGGKQHETVIVTSYKLPDKRRIEDEHEVFIENGTTLIDYDKDTKRYTIVKEKQSFSVNLNHFTPDWIMNSWKKMGTVSAIVLFRNKTTSAAYKGVTYQTLEAYNYANIVLADETKWTLGRFYLSNYINSDTGLIRASILNAFDSHNPSVKRQFETFDYEYNTEMADDLFNFTPPPDATKEQ